MISTVKLSNISISSHSYRVCVCVCVCVVRVSKIYSCSKFPIYNTVLTIVTMLCTISRTYSSYIMATLYPLANISQFPPPPYP